MVKADCICYGDGKKRAKKVAIAPGGAGGGRHGVGAGHDRHRAGRSGDLRSRAGPEGASVGGAAAGSGRAE